MTRSSNYGFGLTVPKEVDISESLVFRKKEKIKITKTVVSFAHMKHDDR
jgi:hypothetical protein